MPEQLEKGRATQVAGADRFADDLMPIIETLQSQGITTLQGLAAELNRRGVSLTPKSTANSSRPESRAGAEVALYRGRDSREPGWRYGDVVVSGA